MSLVTIRWQPTRRDLRLFGTVGLPGLCVVIGLLSANHAGDWRPARAFLIAAAGVALIGGSFPGLLRPVYLLWMALLFPVGWVVSHLLLAFIYYVTITPTSWVLGLLRRRARRPDEPTTFWTVKPPATDPGRFFRQF